MLNNRSTKTVIRSTVVMAVAAALAAGAVPAVAQQKPVIYPAKGQSTEQQQKDDGECYVWAKNATGIDPVALNAAPSPAPAPAKGQAAKGALRGAAGGALVGEVVDDNPGGGAAAGAVVGAARSAQKGKQAQAQHQSQAKASQQQAMSTYYRGFGACMEGRGYVIK
jgi:hypothetical protein